MVAKAATAADTDRRRGDRRRGGRRRTDRRRRLGVALAVLLLLAVGLPFAWPAEFAPLPRTERRTITVGGRERTFRLHHPPRWDPEQPLPLVLAFHGHHGDARVVEYESRLDEAADRGQFLVAYPEGTGYLDRVPVLGRVLRTWNVGTCCAPATTAPASDDVAFAAAIVDALGTERSVDRRRVYATGFSIGGTFSLLLACERSDLVAAVASVEGTMPDVHCAPSRPVPVLLVRGGEDAELRADLAENRDLAGKHPAAESMSAALLFWMRHDGCVGSLTRVPSAVDAREGVVRDSAGRCADGAEVAGLLVHGNAHAWPGGRRPWLLAPAPVQGVRLTTRLVDFFFRHVRG